TIDRAGNLYYHAMQLDRSAPWTADVAGAWLVRVGAEGSVSRATFASLTPNAPAATSLCTSAFTSGLPFPPDPAAVAPKVPCGSQRPGVNVAPAVAADGTIYTVSRAHLNDRWSYLVAVHPDLTPKWAASMRNRFNDGCDVALPPSGTPGGCRAGATRGVDPTDNEPGSGRVRDDSTSSPVVAPDGRILYGAYTRYNHSAGHLMMFTPDGGYVGAYGFGWDITPAIYTHGGTYSIILKENRYNVSSYCNDPSYCPPDRNSATPSNPEQYLITQLDTNLNVEWQYRSTNTLSCSREPSGAINCKEDHPHGFEWCVNALAVDARGVVYANSEDGRLYAIAQGGVAVESIFLRLALGAAYTPLSVDDRGRIYTQNDGVLFAVTEALPRRRAAGR
ncbi:MAG TPA: hypothetical protein VFL80_06945, partial [Thermoanaerobaculia bacterium]|nr:hypothetical protein [Thermoanaerobaculia bacterium]